MQRICIESVARQQLKLATCQEGRQVAADTVIGGHERVLRQTVVGIVQGNELRQRNSSGEATAYVIRGRVQLTAGESSWIVRTGDLLKIPAIPWDLQALEDSAVLLTVARLSGGADDAPFPSAELAEAAPAAAGND